MGVCSAALIGLVHGILESWHKSFALFKLTFEMGLNFLYDRVYITLGCDSLLYQSLAILNSKTIHRPDFLIHLRLCKAWLVDLIVTMLAAANHID